MSNPEFMIYIYTILREFIIPEEYEDEDELKSESIYEEMTNEVDIREKEYEYEDMSSDFYEAFLATGNLMLNIEEDIDTDTDTYSVMSSDFYDAFLATGNLMMSL